LEQIGKQQGCELTASAALLVRQSYSDSRSIAQAYNPSDSQEELLIRTNSQFKTDGASIERRFFGKAKIRTSE